MALCSFAKADITVKIVVPTLGNLLRNAAGYKFIKQRKQKRITAAVEKYFRIKKVNPNVLLNLAATKKAMETKPIEEKTNANTGLKWGGYTGAAYVLCTYFLFTIFKDARCVSFPYSFIAYIFVIVGMFLAAFEKRKIVGGTISFKLALSNSFLVLIISVLCYGIFFYVLFNTISPQLNVSLKKIQLAYILQFMHSFHSPEDTIKEFVSNYNANPFEIDFKTKTNKMAAELSMKELEQQISFALLSS